MSCFLTIDLYLFSGDKLILGIIKLNRIILSLTVLIIIHSFTSWFLYNFVFQKLICLCCLMNALHLHHHPQLYFYQHQQFSSGQFKSGKVKSGKVKSRQVKSGRVKSGQVKLGQVKSGQFKSGQVMSEQVKL